MAGHYGFTDEEIDFINNHDIKYRLGKDADSDVEDTDTGTRCTVLEALDKVRRHA
ncbi:MAG: hypothetical protein IPK19_31240 [Chloroflexi bacterium]|nr:hypothetical protein [Chloroflexota bacterium]